MDVIVIGGGQAALALGFYLRRTGLSWILLDAEDGPGGAWRHTWDGLRLFSPARFSSLPGWLMPETAEEYPSRDEVVAYLAEYEKRYELPIRRPVRVTAVHREADGFRVEADAGSWRARAVVAATGSWRNPMIPDVPGRDSFHGIQMHSAEYRKPGMFAGKRVLIVGGGNSGAQILAEVSRVADAEWLTLEPPSFLPDDVDGRVLFDRATALYRAKQAGLDAPPPASLGQIVMVQSVREARSRGVLTATRPFVRMTGGGVVWEDGREESVDAVIWCTGFRPALDFLRPLKVMEPNGRVRLEGTRSVREPRLWMLGYGDWTGFASATVIGVGRTARATATEISAALGEGKSAG